MATCADRRVHVSIALVARTCAGTRTTERALEGIVMRRSVSTVIAALVTVGTFGANAAPAAAAQGAPPSSATCVSTTGSKVCFEADGDRLWVGDTRADGHHAEGFIVVYAGGEIGTFVSWCENTSGASTWKACSYAEDVPERRWGEIQAFTVEGSRVISSSSLVSIYTSL